MYPGWLSLCYCVRNLEASTRFYEAIGMERLPEASAEGMRNVLRAGSFRLGLFSGITENCLNFRGGDVVALHKELSARIGDLPGTPRTYGVDPANDKHHDGASWMTHDPDGNAVFFDTNASERGESFVRTRTEQVLRDAEAELVSLGASEDCVAALRTQVIERFCGGAERDA